MISIEDQYFSLGKTLLLSIGLWPYQQPLFAQLHYLFVFGILISAILFQFTSFMTAEFTLDLIIKILSSVFIFITLVIKYNAFWLNGDTVKLVLEKLQSTFDQLTDKNELAIIEKYGNLTRLYIRAITALVASGIGMFILVLSSPSVLDVILPRNESRPRHLFLPMEYFVDQQKYFYLIVLHIIAFTCVSGLTILGTGTVHIVFLECTCGMFTVASYRIERAFRPEFLQIKSNNKCPTTQGIITAVDIHRKAMRFSDFIVSKFEEMFALLILCGVISISCNLCRIFQIISSEWNIGEILLSFVFINVTLLYIFFSNYIAQSVTDHNSELFATVYNVPWYSAPLHVQKLILFLLQKSTKDFTLTIAGIFIGSLGNIATITNAALSYFAVIYATQK